MFGDRKHIRPDKLLEVYEVTGGRRLPAPPTRGLAGVWPQQPYYYLFYREEIQDDILAWLKANPEWRLTARYSLPHDKWQDVSGQDVEVGPFTIRPAASPGLPRGRSGAIPIRIDPGVVFGSGLHPTTRGCLLAISGLFDRDEEHKGISPESGNREIRIRTVVDFGTGTGILAIACALLGAKRAWAMDCIPFALSVAARNARENETSDRLGFICADRLSVLNASCDLLVMNIEWPVLKEVLAGESWKCHERVVLSGFLEGVLDRVEEMVRPGYEISWRVNIEGWPTLVLARAG